MVQCSAYMSHDEAAKAVEQLMAAGVPGDDIRVLMGEATRDTAHEGAFAGVGQPARHAGSFADADREIETTYPAGIAHQRVAGHKRIKQLLLDAGLDEATADKDVEALHMGKILVLATS
jgi:hypothetical protein